MTDMIVSFQKRASVFSNDNIPAHIVLKNGTWFNGYIVKVFDDYFNILDREDGSVPVFFADIKIFDFYNGDMSRLKKVEVKDVKQ